MVKTKSAVTWESLQKRIIRSIEVTLISDEKKMKEADNLYTKYFADNRRAQDKTEMMTQILSYFEIDTRKLKDFKHCWQILATAFPLSRKLSALKKLNKVVGDTVHFKSWVPGKTGTRGRKVTKSAVILSINPQSITITVRKDDQKQIVNLSVAEYW